MKFKAEVSIIIKPPKAPCLTQSNFEEFQVYFVFPFTSTILTRQIYALLLLLNGF